LGIGVVGVLLWLLEKTPLTITAALLLIFGMAVHPIWNFWWIEKTHTRRIIALSLVVIILFGLGYEIWPDCDSSSSLHRMSNDELIGATKALTGKLHDLDREIHDRNVELRRKLAIEGNLSPSETMEEFQGRLRNFSAAMQFLNSEYVNGFQKKYLKCVCTSREELVWRLHKHAEDLKDTVLSDICGEKQVKWDIVGRVASDSATELDSLARQLQ